MLEKILRRLRLCKSAKKTAMFFAAFALTISVMCASFTEVRGDTAETTKTNQKLQTTTTEYSVETAAVEQTGIAVSAPARNITAEQAVAKDNDKEESAEATDAQAKPVPIKLSTAAKPAEVEGSSGQAEAPKIRSEQVDTEAQDDNLKEFVYSDKIPLSYELQEYTYQKSIECGLEYELVLAVMWRESRFQANALHLNSNGTFDSGLMQINDINKKWLYEKHGIDNLMDPHQNIDAGTAILGELYKKYGEHEAMLAYQYGENGMIKKLNQGVTTNKSIEAAYRQREYYRQIV